MQKLFSGPPPLLERLKPGSEPAIPDHYLVSLRTLDYLLLGVMLLALASALSHALPFSTRAVYELFRMSSDHNIPAWYSSILLAIGAMLALECGKTAPDADARKAFLILGALLVLMSCDEVARLHETLPAYLANLLALGKFEVFAGRRWLILGAPFALALMLWVLLKVDRALRGHAKERATMLLGFVAILLGGLVLEALAALTAKGDLARFVLVHLEESLEMLGTLLICASLVLIRDRQFRA